jgi:hypothetical protein
MLDASRRHDDDQVHRALRGMELSIVSLRIDASSTPTNWTASRLVLVIDTFSIVRPVVGLGA